MKRRRFPMMLSPQERLTLQVLAQQDGLSGAALVRQLLRLEAQRRELWQPVIPQGETDETRVNENGR
jgi:hypothetical protein